MLAPKRIWIKKQRYGSPDYYKGQPVQIKQRYVDDYEYVKKPTKCDMCGDDGDHRWVCDNKRCRRYDGEDDLSERCLEGGMRPDSNLCKNSISLSISCQCTKDPDSYYSFKKMMDDSLC